MVNTRTGAGEDILPEDLKKDLTLKYDQCIKDLIALTKTFNRLEEKPGNKEEIETLKLAFEKSMFQAEAVYKEKLKYPKLFAVSVIQKSHTRNMNWVIQTAECMKKYIKENSRPKPLRFTDDPPADRSGSTQVSTSGNSNTITFRAQVKEQPSEEKTSSSNSNTLIAQAEIHTQPNAGEGSSQEQPQASNTATPIQRGEEAQERNGKVKILTLKSTQKTV